jgi:catechol 2,3-dioxygenase
MTTSPSPGAIFKPRRIGHVNYWVNNLEEMAAFYRDVVGIQEAYRREAIKAIFLSNGNTYHDVAFMDVASPRGAGKVPGLHHFSLELACEADLVAGYLACQAHGFAFDFTISADVTRSAYGSDPDGNRFEVYADVTRNWRAERSGAVSSGGRPWTPGESPPLTEPCFPVNPPIVSVEGAVFQPVRVSHAVLVAHRFEAMVQHYTRVAGLKPLVGDADSAFVVLGGTLDEETLTLFRDRGIRKPGLHHTGYQLKDEAAFDAAKQRLRERGMVPVIEIEHPTRRSLYLLDPAGQRLQFYVDRTGYDSSWLRLDEELALHVA